MPQALVSDGFTQGQPWGHVPPTPSTAQGSLVHFLTACTMNSRPGSSLSQEIGFIFPCWSLANHKGHTKYEARA